MENSVQQYIDLYTDNKTAINSRSCGIMNDCRPEAADFLSGSIIPKLGSENYEITNLREIFSQNYGLNINRVPLSVNPAESFKCGVPKMTSAPFMLINDIPYIPADSLKNLPEGVEIASLREIGEKNPEMLGRYYNKLADASNSCVALSSLLAQDGLWIRIPKKTKVVKPLQLVNILGGAPDIMAVRRIVIVVEEEAEACLLACDHSSQSDSQMLALQTIEIFVGKNAQFDYYDLEESTENTSRLSSLWLEQKADSRVVINGLTIYNGRTRNEYHCSFAEPGSELKLYGMGIADRNRKIDTYSLVDHDSENCHTEELFKYSVDDNSLGAFTGLIKVAPGAKKTEAYQSNRNLIGSDNARMYSKPQLEIYNDDVKCSHGSAVGKLDEMQLFYMRTRGLDDAQARLLLKQAFMADVIDKVSIPGLKERLTLMVERRFAGESAGCHDCNSECPVNIS